MSNLKFLVSDLAYDLIKFHIEENEDDISLQFSDGFSDDFNLCGLKNEDNGVTIEFSMSDNYGTKTLEAKFTYFEVIAFTKIR